MSFSVHDPVVKTILQYFLIILKQKLQVSNKVMKKCFLCTTFIVILKIHSRSLFLGAPFYGLHSIYHFFFQSNKFGGNLQRLTVTLQKYLKEGVLQDEFVMDNIPKLMNVMRECNVTLRWLMLHTCKLSPGK